MVSDNIFRVAVLSATIFLAGLVTGCSDCPERLAFKKELQSYITQAEVAIPVQNAAIKRIREYYPEFLYDSHGASDVDSTSPMLSKSFSELKKIGR